VKRVWNLMATEKKGKTKSNTSKSRAKAEPEALASTLQEVEPKASTTFPIVGIGASAGGLAAFEAFFSGMPAATEPGMAFVLVQHLAPDHKSILTDLVRRYTRMQVFEVEDGMKVERNCAYIIPPGRDMALFNGTLQLLEPSAPRGHRLPIDFFFRSLAQDQKERAICVVLSGTGSDGTLGVRAIKGEGGMVMVQKPDSTEYDGMPRNAIATGLVDYVLPPAEMSAQLINYTNHSFVNGSRQAAATEEKAENLLKKIYVLLRTEVGHDFSHYKVSTMQRRIERRMAVHQIDTLADYVKYMQQNPAETEALFQDLLIGVTSFFRDPEAFEALEQDIIPKLFSGRPDHDLIRIWVPGCSTGEEAYSLAILLAEEQEKLKKASKVQVFATDIDSRAIAHARAGIYPASIAADISAERLARYFSAEPGGDAYLIQKAIRDLLVFSEQDLIRDPPFSKLDLISCRNLLIYMDGELQKRIVPLFHYALNPGGYLFLGTSESVGEFGDLFTTLDRKQKLYQRKDDFYSGRHAVHLLPSTNASELSLKGSAPKLTPPAEQSLRELTEQAILHQLTPVAALVGAKGEILYLHGRSGCYLEPPPGEPGSANILKMAREGLKRELTTVLHKAVRSDKVVHSRGLKVKTNGAYTTVDLTVRPQTQGSATTAETQLYLVVLEESQYPVPAKDENRTRSGKETLSSSAKMQIIELEQELCTKDEYLQTTNEELETSNEELRAAQAELEKSRARYFELYDLAPVGYLTLSEQSLITLANLTAATLLGVKRSALLSAPITRYILKEDQDIYYKHRKKLLESGKAQECELRMIKDGHAEFKAKLQANFMQDEAGKPQCRVMLSDISEQKWAEDKLHYLSFHDQLTGLYNRHYLEEEMKRLDVVRQLPIGIIMADLNGLKLTNDAHGHSAGDAMLQKAAKILQDACREEDILSRWGGDEFVLMLPQSSAHELKLICTRIKKLCSNPTVKTIPVSIALGYALKNTTEERLTTVLKEAEDCMYRRKLMERQSTKNAMLEAMLKTLAANSYETEAHTRNMQAAAFKIALEYGLPKFELNRLALLITLHDIGKINLPEELLKKCNPLTEDEWGRIKKHPETGYRIAMAINEFTYVAEDILAHHERWDGKGYPSGLKKNEIPLLSRIAAIADTYEVMSNGRPYKKFMTIKDVIAEFKRCSGTQFDPELVELFLATIEKDGQ